MFNMIMLVKIIEKQEYGFKSQYGSIVFFRQATKIFLGVSDFILKGSSISTEQFNWINIMLIYPHVLSYKPCEAQWRDVMMSSANFPVFILFFHIDSCQLLYEISLGIVLILIITSNSCRYSGYWLQCQQKLIWLHLQNDSVDSQSVWIHLKMII